MAGLAGWGGGNAKNGLQPLCWPKDIRICPSAPCSHADPGRHVIHRVDSPDEIFIPLARPLFPSPFSDQFLGIRTVITLETPVPRGPFAVGRTA